MSITSSTSSSSLTLTIMCNNSLTRDTFICMHEVVLRLVVLLLDRASSQETCPDSQDSDADSDSAASGASFATHNMLQHATTATAVAACLVSCIHEAWTEFQPPVSRYSTHAYSAVTR